MKPHYRWHYEFRVWVRRDEFLDPTKYPYWLCPAWRSDVHAVH